MAVFIYADESGNTGRHIFQDPAIYRVGAILSVADVEARLRAVIEPLNLAAGRVRLHAHQMPPHMAGEALDSVLDALDAVGDWALLYGEIEKSYMATTKFVDVVFDSGENQAVPAMWYNLRGFRHLICLATDGALRDRYRREFWGAFLADDMAGIQHVVARVDDFIRTREADRRLKEICRDAFAYVLRHPEDFTLSAAQGRRACQGHTPNLVAFSFIVDAIHRFFDRTGSRPVAFIHDRQQEFGASMREWAAVFGRVRRSEGPGFPRAEMADYNLPELMLPSSQDVFGLQAADLILWTLSRDDAVLEARRERLSERLDPYAISRGTSRQIVTEFYADVARPPPPGFEARARDVLDEWEGRRRERIHARRTLR